MKIITSILMISTTTNPSQNKIHFLTKYALKSVFFLHFYRKVYFFCIFFIIKCTKVNIFCIFIIFKCILLYFKCIFCRQSASFYAISAFFQWSAFFVHISVSSDLQKKNSFCTSVVLVHLHKKEQHYSK